MKGAGGAKMEGREEGERQGERKTRLGREGKGKGVIGGEVKDR